MSFASRHKMFEKANDSKTSIHHPTMNITVAGHNEAYGNSSLNWFIITVVLSIFVVFLYIIFYMIYRLRNNRGASCYGCLSRTCSDLGHKENAMENVGLLSDVKPGSKKEV